ncbi:unnamed protein product [Cylicostephanus goldi]|uniref:NR LBD domain-containing protein n=1 Tax=Cylicostephanus goldi TaxID=71465 RepID=A0A3P6TK27_CYLGO|nr:unnamed protein product [Cylicostephanus goldi]
MTDTFSSIIQLAMLQLVAMSATTAIALDKIDCDMSTVTDYDPAYIKSLFEPFVGRLNEEVTKTCLELGITATEVVYILCTLVWHVEGK